MVQLLLSFFFCMLISSSVFAQNWEQLKQENSGDYNKIIAVLSGLIEENGSSSHLYDLKARAHVFLAEFDEASTCYDESVRLSPSDSDALNNAAWFFATVSNKTFRDPSKAFKHAFKVCQKTDFENSNHIDTLAAAFASQGEFGLAKAMQRSALHIGFKNGRRDAEEALRLYENKQTIENGFRAKAESTVGEIKVVNATAHAVEIESFGWKTANGKISGVGATWDIQPNQKSFLAFDSRRIEASEFKHRVKTANGETPESGYHWIAKYSSGNQLVVNITSEMIPPIRVVAAKPVIPDGVKSGLDTVKELAETAKQAKETYDEVKRLFPEKKTSSSTLDKRKLSADLILTYVDIAGQKSNGDKWDTWMGKNKPDVQISATITRNGKSFSSTTKEYKNIFTTSMNEKMLRIQEGDDLQLVVEDLDAGVHDRVGSYSKTVTAAMIKEKSATWSFDQVLDLSVKFEY